MAYSQGLSILAGLGAGLSSLGKYGEEVQRDQRKEAAAERAAARQFALWKQQFKMQTEANKERDRIKHEHRLEEEKRKYEMNLNDPVRQSQANLNNAYTNKANEEAAAKRQQQEFLKKLEDAKGRLDLCRQVAKNPGDCDEYETPYKSLLELGQMNGWLKPQKTSTTSSSNSNSEVLALKRTVDALAKNYNMVCGYGDDSPECQELKKQLYEATNALHRLTSGGGGTQQPVDSAAKVDSVIHRLLGK